MSNKKSMSRLTRLTVAAVLTALSLVFTFTVRFPMFTSFYEMEFSDFPVLVTTSLLGPVYGLASLLAVCLIQATTVSASSGIIGFLMHFVASGAMILIVYFVRKRLGGIKGAVIGGVLGVAAMVLIMVPMNIWLTTEFMGLPAGEFIKGFLGVCVAFNLIKAGANVLIFSLTFPTLEKQLKALVSRSR